MTETLTGTPTGSVSPEQMRRTMSTFASGVTVVAGVDADGPVGFACQSFASVSLTPPLVLFCADHRGRAWPRIQDIGRFSINVLAADQDDLCARFGSSRGQKFDGLAWGVSEHLTPTLPDVLARVHCTVERVTVAGDHDVVIGRVLGLDLPRDSDPMVFFRGRFGLSSDSALAPANLFGWGEATTAEGALP